MTQFDRLHTDPVIQSFPMKLKLVIMVLVAVGLLSLWAAETPMGNSNGLAVIPLP
jgi:hypothetical protein